jgi:hypothetical protein
MSGHRYRVIKTSPEAGTYYARTPPGWTPFCDCGWVGTEGQGGPGPSIARHVEFVDHLRALPGPGVDLAAGASLYGALIARALEAIRSEEE